MMWIVDDGYGMEAMSGWICKREGEGSEAGEGGREYYLIQVGYNKPSTSLSIPFSADARIHSPSPDFRVVKIISTFSEERACGGIETIGRSDPGGDEVLGTGRSDRQC